MGKGKWLAVFLPLMVCLLTGCSRQHAGLLPDGLQESPAPTGPLAGTTVAVDPGHGGIDNGCVGVSGATEADLNLSIALSLKEALEREGAQVVMTRSDATVAYREDTGKTRKQQDMADRMNTIEETSASMVISIHMNRYSDTSVRGAQVFYFDQSSAGQALARLLQQELNNMPEQTKKRNAMSGNYFILKNPQCISALVECGFLSNPQEEQLLRDPAYQQRLAQALCQGIVTFYQQQPMT